MKKLLFTIMLSFLLICSACQRGTYELEVRTIENDSIVYSEQIDVYERWFWEGQDSQASIQLKQVVSTDTTYQFYQPMISDFNGRNILKFLTEKPIYISKYKYIDK